jgi:hypothetical protein
MQKGSCFWSIIEQLFVFNFDQNIAECSYIFLLCKFFPNQRAQYIATNVIHGRMHDARIPSIIRHFHAISRLWWHATDVVLKWCGMLKRVSWMCCLRLSFLCDYFINKFNSCRLPIFNAKKPWKNVLASCSLRGCSKVNLFDL